MHANPCSLPTHTSPARPAQSARILFPPSPSGKGNCRHCPFREKFSPRPVPTQMVPFESSTIDRMVFLVRPSFRVKVENCPSFNRLTPPSVPIHTLPSRLWHRVHVFSSGKPSFVLNVSTPRRRYASNP